MNKKIIILVVLVIVTIGLLLAVYLIQHKKLTDFPKIQTKMTDNFKKQAFDVSFKGSDTTIKGTLDKSANFKGDILVKDTVVQNIIKVGDKTYTKSPEEEKWQIQQSSAFLSQIGLMTHPEYIQLQKQLLNSGGSYQYSIIFEKPGQDLLKQMSKEDLAKLQMTGTVLLNKSSFQLKELKFHQGKETTNEVIIDYTINPNPPTITEPKI